jgi:hypothetical protein
VTPEKLAITWNRVNNEEISVGASSQKKLIKSRNVILPMFKTNLIYN